jgi:hypothetical protein
MQELYNKHDYIYISFCVQTTYQVYEYFKHLHNIYRGSGHCSLIAFTLFRKFQPLISLYYGCDTTGQSDPSCRGMALIIIGSMLQSLENIFLKCVIDQFFFFFFFFF